MSSHSSGPVNRPVAVALCLMLVCVAVACIGAASAKASFYQMVLCAANNGSNGFQTATNTVSANNPGGIFSIENYCGPAGFPAGNGAFIRIVENQSAGNAGNTAYASVSWTAPSPISIVAGGGYTRQPGEFRDGWRARFWGEDHGGGGPHNILMQGSGVGGGGIFWGTCSTFCSHLWPFGGWGGYRRFIYEMTCVRPAGCDRAGWNGTDANTFILTLDDPSPSQVWLTNGSTLMSGQWVKGTQTATYAWSEQGSGIRFERLYVDNAERWGIDHIAAGQCNRDAWGGVGEFARDWAACPNASNIGRSYTFDTASIPDGAHTLKVCTQDYAQWQGLAGTGGQSCTSGTIRTDNSAPGAPSGLQVTSANPERYLDRFGAQFALPPNSGSPVTKVHYEVTDAAGKVVKPKQTLAATNPTALSAIEGPKEPGEYRLRVWLEDQVGNVGPTASAEVPRDTKPPAAPQGISVVPPSASAAGDGFDVRWRNLADAGSPIVTARYQVVGPNGAVLVPTADVGGEDPQAIESLDAPAARGEATLRVWLRDAEGNVGAASTAPLAYRCPRSANGSGLMLSAGLGEAGDAAEEVVRQDSGVLLRGRLRGPGGGVADASVCVFSRVITDQASEFAGIAMTDAEGRYGLAVSAGPSRELTAVYRRGHRELSAAATLLSRVKPTLEVRRKVVRNKRYARFYGHIPGPHNDRVVVVLQVKQGKGWRAFRRYRTRDNGRYRLVYRFGRTTRPATYLMRAQVRQQGGYPYLPGNSKQLRLRVIP